MVDVAHVRMYCWERKRQRLGLSRDEANGRVVGFAKPFCILLDWTRIKVNGQTDSQIDESENLALAQKSRTTCNFAKKGLKQMIDDH